MDRDTPVAVFLLRHLRTSCIGDDGEPEMRNYGISSIKDQEIYLVENKSDRPLFRLMQVYQLNISIILRRSNFHFWPDGGAGGLNSAAYINEKTVFDSHTATGTGFNGPCKFIPTGILRIGIIL